MSTTDKIAANQSLGGESGVTEPAAPLPTGQQPNEPQPVPREVVVRETIESLAIAFILALIFKAFIAEAFVIPTGSMAPTLMGKHKDVVCKSCEFPYQTGASSEFDQLGRRIEATTVVGTVCPLCRKPQIADPFVDKNEATFSGDRILVNKFAYVWSKPKRWDVFVFKYFYDARLNYIKRCVGLPDETLRIQHGDIYVRNNKGADPSDPKAFEIARKPPHVVNAMLQPINDTQHISKELVRAGVPSYWQPQESQDSAWSVEWTESEWSATAKNPTQDPSWLRYYHRVIDIPSWNYLEDAGKLPAAPLARQPRIVTDFTAYNSSYTLSDVSSNPEEYAEQAFRALRSSIPNDDLGNDGIHWTGDLAGEFDVDIAAGTKSISLMIVEAGDKHIVDIDLATGLATASVTRDGQKLSVFRTDEGLGETATAQTALRAGGKHRIKFSNVDDQFLLWVNGRVANWSPSNELRWNLSAEERVPGPRSTDSDPLDGAPVGIAVSQGEMKITRAKVSRDIYYIAHFLDPNQYLYDYVSIKEKLRLSVSSTPAEAKAEEFAMEAFGRSIGNLPRNISSSGMIRDFLAQSPQVWGDSLMTTARRNFDFTMEHDWYFPLGDNSAASSDARSWPESHTPENLLIGRAIVVFWPHWWNAPVPFIPNFQRMGLIR